MSEVITADEVARELTNVILLCLKYLKQTEISIYAPVGFTV